MTEGEWLACPDPKAMLDYLKGSVSNRKLRLFAVACCRLVWDRLTEHTRNAVLIAEKYADKLVKRQELTRARMAVYREWLKSDLAIVDGPRTLQYPAVWNNWEAAEGSSRIASLLAPKPPSYYRLCNAKRTTKAMEKKSMRDCFMRRREMKLRHTHLLRCIFNPHHPVHAPRSWINPTVYALADQMYESRDFSAMPILADALQDVGCDNEDILNHCRLPGEHCRGCWVVDLCIGKE